jgi:hypothetical protein
MMDEMNEGLIIEGFRTDGSRFRPSDWIDRLSSLMSTFGPDHQLHYSPGVHPCVIGGEWCLVLAWDLAETQPDVYRQILQFATDNQLRIQHDRRQQELPVVEERRKRPGRVSG